LPLDDSIQYYKVCLYDENKDFKHTSTGARRTISVADNTDLDYENWKYARIQFAKEESALMIDINY
jgi:hypothetical protein